MVKSSNKKNISKKKVVLIFGGSSEMASHFIKYNIHNYFFHITTSKVNKLKKKYEKFNNIKINNLKLLEKNSRTFFSIKYDYLLTFNGYFKRDQNFNQKILDINYLYIQNILYNNYKSYKKKKRDIKVIVISSLDSFYPNKNSPAYSTAKGAISHLIKNLQHMHKNEKIQYSDIQPGAVKTKMRSKKKGSALSAVEIAKTIDYIISLNINTTVPKVQIFPKSNFYLDY